MCIADVSNGVITLPSSSPVADLSVKLRVARKHIGCLELVAKPVGKRLTCTQSQEDSLVSTIHDAIFATEHFAKLDERGCVRG